MTSNMENIKEYKTLEAVIMLLDNKELIFKSDTDCGIKYIKNIRGDILIANKIENLDAIDSKVLPLSEYYLELNWTLVKKSPVPFMEAIDSFRKGNDIHCICNTLTFKYTYNTYDGWDYMQDDGNCHALTANEIMEGKWFID